MSAPLVGITTYHREREGRVRFSLPGAYVDGVRLAGGLPVLLAPGEASPASLLDRLDALVFSGGGDLHPQRYNGAGHDTVYATCDERDEFELALLHAALERELPLLAICRGAQVLNTALGGDLHAHLPDAVGERVTHRRSQEEPAFHPVRIDPGSGLAELLGGESLQAVASWHHQGVRTLGRGLRAVAWAEDGTVEALALDGAPGVLAVQWHPELQLEEASPQRRLFARLVQLARS